MKVCYKLTVFKMFVLNLINMKKRVPQFGLIFKIGILVFSLLINIIWVPTCNAQQPGTEPALTRKLNQFLDTALKPSLATQEPGSMKELVNLFDTPLPDTAGMAYHEAEVIRAKMEKVASDRGFQLRMDYLENLDNGIYNVQSGGFYKRRGFMELSWDLLKGGIAESKHEAKALQKELKLYQLKQAKQKQGHEFSFMFNRIIYTFNKAKLKYLKRRQMLLERKAEVDRQRFEDNQILYEEVINTTSELRETKQMKDNVEEYNKNVNPQTPSKVNANDLPIVDIYIDSVLAEIRQRSWTDTMMALRKAIQREKIHPANEIRLSPYFRHNIYNNPDGYVNNLGEDQGNLRQFFSWGLSLSLPLNISEDEERALQNAKLDRAKAKIRTEQQVEVKEALNTYYEYQYALNDYIEFYHKKAALLEKVRQHKARRRIKDQSYSPVRLLKHGLSVAKLNFELADIQQRMYIKLLNIKQHLTKRELADVVKKHPVRSHVANFQQKRGVYMWSGPFMDKPNRRLIKRLNVNQVDQVMLSLGPDNEARAKAERFIQKAKANRIAVTLLVGDNQLFRQKNHEKLSGLVSEAKALGAQGLHLDVEPHTLQGWDDSRSRMLDQYQEMAEKAHALTADAGLQLGLAVPIWYEFTFLENLYKHCDRLTLMAYKRTEIVRLKETLQPFAKHAGKTVIALRPADFGSMPAFYQFTKNLKNKTPINQFAIHDFATLDALNAD